MDGAQAHGTTDIRRVLADLFEWAALAGAAPFLLFPSLRPDATLAGLGGLVAIWGITTVLREEAWPLTPFNGALLLFVPMVGVGILVSALPELTLPKATGLILGLAAFRAVATTRERLFHSLALWGLLLVGVIILVAGILATRWPLKVPALEAVLKGLPESRLRLPEAPEGGVNPNELAGALTLYAPFPLAVLLDMRPRWRRVPGLIAALVGLALIAGTLFLSQSRSAWIGAIAGLLALAFCWAWHTRRWLRPVVLIPLFLLLIMGGLTIWQVGLTRLLLLLDVAGGHPLGLSLGTISLQGRLELWSRALYAIADFPFTGCGLGTFRRIVHLLYPLSPTGAETDIAHAHNTFLQVALDVGLPGLIGYLAILGIGVFRSWSGSRREKRLRWMCMGLFAGLVGLHTYGLTDALALGAKPTLGFWIALGLLANPLARSLERPENGR